MTTAWLRFKEALESLERNGQVNKAVGGLVYLAWDTSRCNWKFSGGIISNSHISFHNAVLVHIVGKSHKHSAEELQKSRGKRSDEILDFLLRSYIRAVIFPGPILNSGLFSQVTVGMNKTNSMFATRTHVSTAESSINSEAPTRQLIELQFLSSCLSLCDTVLGLTSPKLNGQKRNKIPSEVKTKRSHTVGGNRQQAPSSVMEMVIA